MRILSKLPRFFKPEKENLILNEWKISFSEIELDHEETAAVIDVIKSRWLTMGEVSRRFELEFAEYLNVPHALAVSSCTAALHMANVALGVGAGAEVICPALTFVATVNSVLYCGGKVVFADICGTDDLTISPVDIERKITPNTKGIIVMHYGGYACRMREILEIARENNLFVIEDAAHAPGASISAQDLGGSDGLEAKLGTIGDVGCFSFFSNKNMATGEGGMLVTRRAELSDQLARLRSHGMTTLTLERHKGHTFSYGVTDLGYNYRIDEIRSAIGIAQLRKLEKNNLSRKKLVQYYRSKLKKIRGLSVPFNSFAGKSAYHLFPVLLERGIDREGFMGYLKAAGVQTSIHYPPVHLFDYLLRRYNFSEGDLPVTEDVARRIVTLPLYPSLSFEQVDYIVRKITDYIEETVAKGL
jgi:dTDP-4-amino-4,6-dideoxygalactose transaminase